MNTFTTSLPVATLMLLASALSAAAAEAQPAAKEIDYIRPFPVVMIADRSNRPLKDAADDVAKAIDVKLVGESKTNPVCCVWIEISNWAPNPGQAGYWIVNQPGGSLISASNAEQLKLAVERFKAAIRQRNGHAEVPLGVLTNYPVPAVR
ncbi:MAG: hypothetical protein K8T91_06710 [Planctomycetes bacterium]|nr:hypothetical protein [Planctomycetota bacterium]